MGEMRRVETMIDANLLNDVTGAVMAGDYASRDDVIRVALEAWRESRDAHRERLRALIDPALASTPVAGGFDAEEIKREGRLRLAKDRR